LFAGFFMPAAAGTPALYKPYAVLIF